MVAKILLLNTEEKAKVVAAVWGTEFIKFLASQAILHQDEAQDEFILFSNHPCAIHPNLQIVPMQNS